MTAQAVRDLVAASPRYVPPLRDDDAARVAPPPFRRVPISGAEAPPTTWVWQDYIPRGHVTLLAGHGGAGKSTMALLLAACVALGRECLGVATTSANVAYYSAEDPPGLLLLRLSRIAHALGEPLDGLRERLHLLDATGPASILYAGGERGAPGGPTATYHALAEYVAEHRIGLLVIDNASDAYDGDEIRRREVRAFVQALGALVREHGGAVLLLAHVDKLTARGMSTESYTGSTAWHNSARSRLLLRQPEPGQLELLHEKSNLGRLREPLSIAWPTDGVPMVDRPMSPVVAGIQERRDTAAVLRLIAEFTARGEFVSTATTSRTHAARLLNGQPGYPAKLSDGALFDLLRDAERRGWLARVEHRGADRHRRERWEVTDAGRAFAEIRSGAGTAATAATAGVTAQGAPAAEPCGDCGDFAAGVIGGKRAADVAAPGGRA